MLGWWAKTGRPFEMRMNWMISKFAFLRFNCQGDPFEFIFLFISRNPLAFELIIGIGGLPLRKNTWRKGYIMTPIIEVIGRGDPSGPIFSSFGNKSIERYGMIG